MTSTAEIEFKLRKLFDPQRLVVLDESVQHAGHYFEPDSPSITHLRVRVISDTFNGMNRLARHRAVNEALRQEIDGGLHALAIEAASPGEKTRW